MELETSGFMFLFLLFGENFKKRNLKPSKCQVPPILKDLNIPTYIRGIKFPSLKVKD